MVVKFYIDKADVDSIKAVGSGKELDSIFLWREFDKHSKNYEITISKIKKINKEPMRQKLRSAWNGLVQKFLL